MIGRLVNLAPTDNGLRIELTASGRQHLVEYELRNKATDEALAELLEYQLCNGWTWLRPEQIGALTDAPILSDEVTENDRGELVSVGRVWWHERYAVEDPIELLQTQGYVLFRRGE